MCYRIKMGIMAVAILSLMGCCSIFPSMPWCSNVSKPSDSEIAARMQVVKNRELAESAVSAIKEKFKDKETEEAYLNARDLYNKAMSENNAWLSALTLSIENNENLEKAESFKKQSQAAFDAAESFLAYGKEALKEKPVMKGAVFETKSLTLAPIAIGDLLTALVTNGITIWRENRAQQAQARKDRAENIRKELSWRTWKEIQ